MLVVYVYLILAVFICLNFFSDRMCTIECLDESIFGIYSILLRILANNHMNVIYIQIQIIKILNLI